MIPFKPKKKTNNNSGKYWENIRISHRMYANNNVKAHLKSP